MKRMITAATLVLFAASAWGADQMVLPAKSGDVKFAHKKHQEKLNSCDPCHATPQGGKIEGFGKDVAHKLCKDCHVQKAAGPTTCAGCHKQP